MLAGGDFDGFVFQYTGYLREYFNHQSYKDCCEFWAPLGAIDDILSQKVGHQVVVERDSLVHWLLNAIRVEDGVASDQYAFQVLEIGYKDQALIFWRTNQPKGKFLRCSDPSWQRTQDEKRRQASNARAKDYQRRQDGDRAWANYQRSDRSGGGRGGGYSSWGSGHRGQDWQRDDQQSRSGWNS